MAGENLLTLKISGAAQLQKKLEAAPRTNGPILADAINASLAEIAANAIDNGPDDIFHFKTPRPKRTGFLSVSFNQGIKLATASQLWGSIGPTVYYAIFVHEGTSRGIKPNPFMPRLAKAADSGIRKIFQTALEQITNSLT